VVAAVTVRVLVLAALTVAARISAVESGLVAELVLARVPEAAESVVLVHRPQAVEARLEPDPLAAIHLVPAVVLPEVALAVAAVVAALAVSLRNQSSLNASSTSSACSATFTFGKMWVIFPSFPMM